MTLRKESFSPGKLYHCFNRSIEKRVAFTDREDYQRFIEILYLGNSQTPLRRNDIGAKRLEEVLELPRSEILVGIQAFCIMPDHFHLVIREGTEGGITTFMRKLGTAYTLYFNSRHQREGNLFLKPFQSQEVPLVRRSHALNYVHASPASLYEPAWRTGHVVDPQFVGEHLVSYPYSSLQTHLGLPSPLGAVLDPRIERGAERFSVEEMLYEARQYRGDFPLGADVI